MLNMDHLRIFIKDIHDEYFKDDTQTYSEYSDVKQFCKFSGISEFDFDDKLIKHTVNIQDRYLPAVALAVGILMGSIALLVPELRTDLSVSAHLLGGALSGLSASGLYDLSAKTIIDKEVK